MRRRIPALLAMVAVIGCSGGARDERLATMNADVFGGPVCGSRNIIGVEIDDVVGGGSCGIDNPVRVGAVGGVTLSRPTRMTCTTARTLEVWVEKGLKPAVGRMGGGPVELQVAAGYACRTRNSQPGAKVSEHAKGHAIDISAIHLEDGRSLNVERDWRGGGREGRILRRLHAAACGPFTTVLGPESDRFHQDHMHFDIEARRRAYCR